MERDRLEEMIAIAPFPIMLPGNMDFYNESLRIGGNLRPTFRYLLKSGERVFRVKEFFMDWFYTGFPKSIMKTLVDTYGGISSHETGGINWFYGTNYKGNNSATFHHSGVTLEIECESGADWKDFSALIGDMIFPEGVLERFRNKGFVERSFLAKGNMGGWWEDIRIGSMRWTDLDVGRLITPLPQGMGIVSYGSRMGSKGMGLRTVIASDGNFTRAVWYDVLDMSSDIEHGFYEFRRGGDLFDESWDDTVYFRTPGGPCAYQVADSGCMFTVAFSPGFTKDEVKEMMPAPDNVMSMVRKISALTGE